MQEQKEKKNVFLVALLVLICLIGIGISTVDYLLYFRAIENKKEGLQHYVKNELDEAIAKLESADKKDKEVLYYLGVAYRKKGNDQKSAEYFTKALKEKQLFHLESPARSFVSKAAIELADLYATGHYGTGADGQPDFEKAAEYYQVSFAVESNPHAAYKLGELYRKGCIGKKADGQPNRKIAAEYYQIGADLCRGPFSGEEGIGELSNLICKELIAIYMDGRIDYAVIGRCYEQVLNPDYNEVETYYLKAMREQGSAEAAYRLGKLYAEDPGFQKKKTNGQPDFVKAAEYFLSAVKKGHTAAAYSLGRLYEDGEVGNDLGSKGRFAKAAEYYEKAALAGNHEAMYRLGELYRIGYENQNGRLNAAKAEMWYRKAAEAGNGHAAYRLGYIQECGSAEFALYKITYEEHVRLLQSLIAKAELLGTLGADLKRYKNGLETLQAGRPLQQLRTKEGYAKAAEYYQKAIELGSDSAVLALGMLYLRGNYGELANGSPDYEKAYEYFARGDGTAYKHPNVAIDLHIDGHLETDSYYSSDLSPWLFRSCMLLAERGNPDALCELGNLYSIQKNYAKAAEYYQKAVEKGSRKAVILSIWLNHIIVPDQSGEPDYAAAEKALKEALKKGISEAVYRYIEAVRDGKTDLKLVQEHLEILASKGEIRAIRQLAEYYRKGLFTDKPDYEKAAEYYEKAASAGDSGAAMLLAELYTKGYCGVLPDGQPDYARAAELYRKICADGKAYLHHEKAYRELGKFYHYGFGGKKDLEKALSFYKKSLNRSPFPELILLLNEMQK